MSSPPTSPPGVSPGGQISGKPGGVSKRTMTIGGFLVAALLAIGGGVIAAKALDGTDLTSTESTRLTAVPVTNAVEVTVASRPTTSVESLTTAATTALAPVIEIRPVAASASFVRESVERLRCGGSYLSQANCSVE